jgi:hypothetical protein
VDTVRKIILITLAIHLVIGAMAANRAWVQVRRLDVKLGDLVLRGATTARVDVVSTGRVPVRLSLELIQGTHAETVAVALVRPNANPFWDPRNKPDSMSAVVSPAVLSHFASGPMLVRATARGAPQWMREPPPLVRDVSVEIPPAAATPP